MNVLVFGATGMIGQGVLRECLLDPGVGRVVVIGRQHTGMKSDKLRDVVQADVTDLSALEGELRLVDACLFCLGVSSAGMSEERYTRLTYDLTLSVARTLARVNPDVVFVYVSGMGTDSTEHGRVMWARVKGRTENALLALRFRAAYMFRPGFVQPVAGARSKTVWYRALYTLTTPLMPLVKRSFPKYVTTTEEIGRAMLAVSRRGYEKAVLESRDITRVARNTIPLEQPAQHIRGHGEFHIAPPRLRKRKK
ncbi:MAG TPA: NAD-dependent epimerase/dehydratase family protein [Vicinamibacterales bacterium]|nr:NAD-dependent epimerase/dehydratase family protein [Vicinamibacterales bacterium]